VRRGCSDHTARLAAYWTEALGGPPTYSTAYGDETFVVRAHSGNGRHEEIDRRAIACFDQALDDVSLTDRSELTRVLHDYFAWATTTTMDRYPSPPPSSSTVCRSRSGPGTGSSSNRSHFTHPKVAFHASQNLILQQSYSHYLQL
jgi:hypothetical protein